MKTLSKGLGIFIVLVATSAGVGQTAYAAAARFGLGAWFVFWLEERTKEAFETVNQYSAHGVW